MSEADYYDVIIIGGGVSGLAAASKLLELGHENIIVLEASDRLGGRINTEETTGKQRFDSFRMNKIFNCQLISN